MEFYRAIQSHSGYQISNLGNIKSLKKGKECIKKTRVSKEGYLRVRFCENSIKKYYSVHRLVAFAFLPNLENKKCVNHKNGIKSDNRVDNLEWVTHSENSTHSFKLGLQKSKKGNNSINSKITELQADYIRENKYNRKQKDLASEFGISQSQISRIVTKQQRK